jgi:predicted heme/steroid binding protein
MSAEQFTRRQLLDFDGETNSRKLIAYRGVVYDVTNCPKWRTALHEGLHFPGQDLTPELDRDAPHRDEVFLQDCVRPVGILIDYSG